MTALFESMRIRQGEIPFLERHVARLRRATAATGMAPPPGDLVHRVRERRGAMNDGALRATWDGVTLAITERDVPANVSLAMVLVREAHPGYPWKSVERGAFDRALEIAVGAGAGEALFVAPDGHVAEAARFSFGWIDGDRVMFPPLALRVLMSLGRERVLELAPSVGLTAAEARVRPQGLAGKPLFLANAVRGVVPVSSLDGVTVPRDERIAALAERFWP